MSLRLANRRKQPDLLLQLLAWFNGFAVVSLLAALFITAIAKPDLETLFDRYYEIPLRQTWNQDMLIYIGSLLGVSCLSSIVGLLINSKRLRRKGDHVHATLIVSLILSIIGLFFFLNTFYI